jgi:hypothetical protein
VRNALLADAELKAADVGGDDLSNKFLADTISHLIQFQEEVLGREAQKRESIALTKIPVRVLWASGRRVGLPARNMNARCSLPTSFGAVCARFCVVSACRGAMSFALISLHRSTT